MSERIRGEVARSDRSGRRFSLVLFRVKPRQRFSVSRHRLVRALQRRCRTTDVVGWFSSHCLCALLPDTPLEGARVFASGICDLVAITSPRPLWAAYSYPDSWLRADGAACAVRPNGVPTAIDCPGEPQADERRVRSGSADAGKRRRAGSRDDDGRGHLSGAGQANGHGGREAAGHAAEQFLGEMMPHGTTDDDGGVGRGLFHEGAGHGGTAVVARRGSARSHTLESKDLLPYFARGLRAGLEGVHLTAAKPAPARATPAEAAQQAIDETPHSVLVRPTPAWKRVLDVVGAAAGLALLSPLFVAAALGVLLTSGRPIMFRQRRAGLGGEPFWIYKFRTMVTDAERRRQELSALSEQDGPAFKLRNDPRVTPIGRLLRTTSIDELPQLWNVLKGDMSLVGPRPLPCDESDACAAWQRRRLDVTPGLTCIWQVRGRSTVSFAEWVRMDVAYMRRRTLPHDVWLLLCTVPAVLLRRGAR